MSENTQDQAIPAPEAPADAETSEDAAASTPVAPGDDAQTREPAEAGDTPAPKKTGGFQKRISQLTQRLREAEEELVRSRAEAQPQPAVEAKAPNRDDFEDYESYLIALTDHRVEQKVAEREATRAQKENQVRAEREYKALEREWNKREEAVVAKYEDYQDVAYADDHMVSPAMAGVIKASEIGPEIAYYLGKHPSESDEIADLSPAQAALAIGRIEERLRQQQSTKPKRSNAPPPAEAGRTGASESSNQLSEKMTPDQWIKARRKQLYG